MQFKGDHEDLLGARETAAREKMRQAVLCAFCHVVQTTGLKPMAVLGLAASAIVSIYKDVAAAHVCNDDGPCCWQPQTDPDVETLQRAIAAEAKQHTDLRWLKVAGKA